MIGHIIEFLFSQLHLSIHMPFFLYISVTNKYVHVSIYMYHYHAYGFRAVTPNVFATVSYRILRG